MTGVANPFDEAHHPVVFVEGDVAVVDGLPEEILRHEPDRDASHAARDQEKAGIPGHLGEGEDATGAGLSFEQLERELRDCVQRRA